MKIVIVADDLLGDEETHQALLDAVAASGGVCHLDTGIERIQVRLLGVVTERQEVSYDLFGNESSYPVDVIESLEGA